MIGYRGDIAFAVLVEERHVGRARRCARSSTRCWRVCRQASTADAVARQPAASRVRTTSAPLRGTPLGPSLRRRPEIAPSIGRPVTRGSSVEVARLGQSERRPAVDPTTRPVTARPRPERAAPYGQLGVVERAERERRHDDDRTSVTAVGQGAVPRSSSVPPSVSRRTSTAAGALDEHQVVTASRLRRIGAASSATAGSRDAAQPRRPCRGPAGPRSAGQLA